MGRDTDRGLDEWPLDPGHHGRDRQSRGCHDGCAAHHLVRRRRLGRSASDEYYDERRADATHQTAMQRAFRGGARHLLDLADDGLGLLTLLTSSIGPVHDFGVYAAVGSGWLMCLRLPCSERDGLGASARHLKWHRVFWNGALLAMDPSKQRNVGCGLGGHRRRFRGLGKRVARGQQID